MVFFRIVEKPDDNSNNTRTVRSRARADLEELAKR
jgi:hypothetical protein